MKNKLILSTALIFSLSCLTPDLQSMGEKRKDFDEEKEENPNKRSRQEETKETGTQAEISANDSNASTAGVSSSATATSAAASAGSSSASASAASAPIFMAPLPSSSSSSTTLTTTSQILPQQNTVSFANANPTTSNSVSTFSAPLAMPTTTLNGNSPLIESLLRSIQSSADFQAWLQSARRQEYIRPEQAIQSQYTSPSSLNITFIFPFAQNALQTLLPYVLQGSMSALAPTNQQGNQASAPAAMAISSDASLASMSSSSSAAATAATVVSAPPEAAIQSSNFSSSSATPAATATPVSSSNASSCAEEEKARLQQRLFTASAYGNWHEAQNLIKNGADVHAKNEFGRTILFDAAAQNNLKATRYLIETCGAQVDERDNEGNTPLIFLASIMTKDKEHDRVVPYLLTKKADINAKNNRGSTALHEAIRTGHLLLAHLLIHKNADVNAQDNEHDMPIDFMISLLKKDEGHVHISFTQPNAIQLNRSHLLSPLIENLIIKGGRIAATRALHIAVELGIFELAERAIKAGADVNDYSRLHYYHWGTPLSIAVYENSEPIVRVLLANKALVDAYDPNEPEGTTQLMMAMYYKYADIVRTLLEYKADIARTNRLILHKFYTDGLDTDYEDADEDVFKELHYMVIAAGLDLNSIDESGETLICSFITNVLANRKAWAKELLSLLIACGSDPSQPNINGETYLQRIHNLLTNEIPTNDDEYDDDVTYQVDYAYEFALGFAERTIEGRSSDTINHIEQLIIARKILKDAERDLVGFTQKVLRQKQAELKQIQQKLCCAIHALQQIRRSYSRNNYKLEKDFLEKIKKLGHQQSDLEKIITRIEQTLELRMREGTGRPVGQQQPIVAEHDSSRSTTPDLNGPNMLDARQATQPDVWSFGMRIAEFLQDMPSSNTRAPHMCFNADQIRIFDEFIRSFLQSHRPPERDAKEQMSLSANALVATICNELVELDINNLNASELLDHIMEIVWTGTITTPRLGHIYQGQIGMQQTFRTALQSLLEQRIIAAVQTRASAESHESKDDNKDNNADSTSTLRMSLEPSLQSTHQGQFNSGPHINTLGTANFAIDSSKLHKS